jgi:hypothetical protein
MKDGDRLTVVVTMSSHSFEGTKDFWRKVFFAALGTFLNRHGADDDQFVAIPLFDCRRRGHHFWVIANTATHRLSPASKIVCPEMLVRIVNRIDLEHVFHDFTGDMDLVTVETLAENQVTIESEFVHGGFDDAPFGDDQFHIVHADLTRAHLAAGVTG